MYTGTDHDLCYRFGLFSQQAHSSLCNRRRRQPARLALAATFPSMAGSRKRENSVNSARRPACTRTSRGWVTKPISATTTTRCAEPRNPHTHARARPPAAATRVHVHGRGGSSHLSTSQFYRGQVILNAKGQFFAWTRWGRVGEGGQCALAGPSALAPAIAAFTKKFKAKSGHAWVSGEHAYGDSHCKKYTIIHEKHSSGQSAKLAGAGPSSTSFSRLCRPPIFVTLTSWTHYCTTARCCATAYMCIQLPLLVLLLARLLLRSERANTPWPATFVLSPYNSTVRGSLAGMTGADPDEDVKYAPPKIKGKLASFTNFITNNDMFAEQPVSPAYGHRTPP